MPGRRPGGATIRRPTLPPAAWGVVVWARYCGAGLRSAPKRQLPSRERAGWR